jgi:hypothetical protein
MFRELWGRRWGADPSRSERERVAAAGDDDQMHRIRHQAIAQEAALVLPRPFGQQRQTDLIDLLGIKGTLAVFAPLSDMVGCADRHHARCSRHEPSFSPAPDAVNRAVEGESEGLGVYV